MTAAFPHPVLVADIGGTNARFALAPEPGAPLSAVRRLPTSAHADLAEAARHAVDEAGWPAPRSLLAGVAGAVIGRGAALSNADWRIDGPAVAKALGLEQGLLLNDFETLAVALPALGQHDAVLIGAPRGGAGARLVVGPGTGLGVAALAEAGGRLLPLSSEGGHVGLGPETAQERNVFDAMGFGPRRAQAEMVLAGPALPQIARALALVSGRTPAASQDTAALVAEALADPACLEADAVRFQLALLARFCGDMALTFLATGGVWLAGGMLPRLAPLMDKDAFRTAFARNEQHAALLARMPVRLITAADPALTGLAALAATPERYLIDYSARLWR